MKSQFARVFKMYPLKVLVHQCRRCRHAIHECHPINTSINPVGHQKLLNHQLRETDQLIFNDLTCECCFGN